MSELINTRTNRDSFRWQLLTTVSAIALLTINGFGDAKADDDANRPIVWVELGGQLEALSGQGEMFSAPFLVQTPTPMPFIKGSPLNGEKTPLLAIGGEGRVSFEPEGSDWIFSASIRYGRSGNRRQLQQQTGHAAVRQHGPITYSGYHVSYEKIPERNMYADTSAEHHESHAVLDFQAGKDFGLGLLGHGTTANFNFGVRFAQFASKADVNIQARPHLTWAVKTYGHPTWYFLKTVFTFRSYHLSGQISRSFHGIGPSISWDASTILAGNKEKAQFAVDWGANASILFGRQLTNVQHQTHAQKVLSAGYYSTLYQNPATRASERTVTVPNVGGFAGLSVKFPNAKISLGYRADFFFGAIDGGIDTRKEETLGFKGPYASISVGLGG